MEDNRTIGEKIAAAYRPFLASKPVGPVDDIVASLGKDIDNNMKRLFWRSEEWRDVAYRLYVAATSKTNQEELLKKASDAYGKAIDNDTSDAVPDLATMQIRLRDIEKIAHDLYIQLAEADNCIAYNSLGKHRATLEGDISKAMRKYQAYQHVTKIVDDASIRDNKGTTG